MRTVEALIAAIVAGSLALKAAQGYGDINDDYINGVYRFGWANDEGWVANAAFHKVFMNSAIKDKYIYYESLSLVKDAECETEARVVSSILPTKDEFSNLPMIGARLFIYTPASEPRLIDELGKYCRHEDYDDYHKLLCDILASPDYSKPFTFETIENVKGYWSFFLHYTKHSSEADTIEMARIKKTEKFKYIGDKGELWATSEQPETTCNNLPLSIVRYSTNVDIHNKNATVEGAQGFPNSPCYGKDSLYSAVRPEYLLVQRGTAENDMMSSRRYW